MIRGEPRKQKAPASTTLRVGHSPSVEARATGFSVPEEKSGTETITPTASAGKLSAPRALELIEPANGRGPLAGSTSAKARGR